MGAPLDSNHNVDQNIKYRHPLHHQQIFLERKDSRFSNAQAGNKRSFEIKNTKKQSINLTVARLTEGVTEGSDDDEEL